MSVAPAHPKAQSRPAVARRAGALKGRVRVPGDKSISHRALMLGLLTVGETRIEGLLEGDDTLATVGACGALGAKLQRMGPGPGACRARASARFCRPARRSISAMPAPARG